MTGDELIADLNERIDRAVRELRGMQHKPARTNGKISGLLLVKDWLRSYPSVTDDDEPECSMGYDCDDTNHDGHCGEPRYPSVTHDDGEP